VFPRQTTAAGSGAAASSIVVSRKYPRATVVYTLVIAVTIADYIAIGVLVVLMLWAAVALFSRAKF
jgi:hypothetical protein